MAGKDNLVSLATRTTEEKRAIGIKGGKASGEARREKATMKKMLETCLEMKNNKGIQYKELVTLGLLKGAMNGNATNYRAIVEMLGELSSEGTATTPSLKIEVVDNGSLDKVLYETNRHNENDERQ